MMQTFDATVQPLADTAQPGKAVLGGRQWPVLMVPPEHAARPFSLSFEEVEANLGRLDRLFFEPDGSFVWRGEAADETWQVEGLVADAGGRVLFVEIKGRCPAPHLDQLLAAFGAGPLMFQLRREGAFLAEPVFREFSRGPW